MPTPRSTALLLLALLTLALEASGQVCCCRAANARYNVLQRPKSGYDYVPIVADDSLGLYVAYSAKQNDTDSDFSGTSNMFVVPLDGDEVLVFGGGFGDTGNIPGGAFFDADYDVAFVKEAIEGCMGRDSLSTRVRFVAPHGHPDHITVAFIRALERAGLEVVEIAYHEGDRTWIEQLPWQPHHPALFNVLYGGGCNEEIGPSYSSPLGRVWFTHRSGHTPGSIDLVIDVLGNPDERVLVLGSSAGGCAPPSGVAMTLAAHGTILLGGPRRAQTDVMPGRGVNRVCLTSRTPPKLGATWVADVEISGHPDATTVYILGTDCALEPGKLTPYGELLINPQGNVQVQGTRPVMTGTLERIGFAIPKDPTLMGRSCYVQATILGGGVELCNGLRLVIGF